MTPLRFALTGFIGIWCRSGLGRQETKHLIWGESMGALLGHGPGPQSSPCRGRRFSDRIYVRTGGTGGREEDDRRANDCARSSPNVSRLPPAIHRSASDAASEGP
jgi:hypothetical protein